MHGVRIKAFRSDNGGEFTSNAFEEFLASSGCKHEVSAAYSQEQNGVAERVNRTIVGRAMAMLYGAQLPLCLWAEAARTAVYIMNRTPTRSQTKTPYELWTGKPAQSLVYLQPFGCEILHRVTKDLRRKWEPNTIKGHLVGYEGRNQYRVYCNHSIIITRDVDFVPPAPAPALYPPVEIINEDEEEDSEVASKPSKADLQADTPPPPPADDTNRSQHNEETLDSIIVKAPAPGTAVDDEATSAVVGPSRRQSSRKNAGIFSTPRFHEEQSQSTQQTGSNKGHAAVAQATTSIEEPQTWEEAMDSPQRSQWEQACQEELASILKNKVLTKVHRNQTEHRNIIGCRWVFMIMYGPKGEVQWYKA
jgi:hypothetical protein